MAKSVEAADKAKQRGASKQSQFLRDVLNELKKVHWPTRRQMMVYTGVVLVSIAIMSVLAWLVDSGLTWLMTLILY